MNQTIQRPANDAVLTPREVASVFNVTPKTVSRWHDSGILPGHRTAGGHRRFRSGPVYDLFDYLTGVGEPR